MSRALPCTLGLMVALSLGCTFGWDDVTVVGVDRGDSWWWDSGEELDDTEPWHVLIYSGNGGVGEDGFYGSMTHLETEEVLEAQGLSITRRDTWPSSMLNYRLILMPAPGLLDEQPFTTGQASELKRFLDDGGVLLVEAENDTVMSYTVLNALLEDLDLDLRLEGGYIRGDALPAQADPLTLGLHKVGVLAGSRVDGARCILSVGPDCAAAAADVGEGVVVVLGDGNMLSGLETWTEQGYENQDLLLRFAGL